ncbi:MAG: class I SAM-dependent methyltransferase [Theionarchaea archaeon]|nr:class I SAM-dependent methyltransferase [Theionarchaea archaeon]
MVEEVKETYDRLAESYDVMFSGGSWAVYDAITWKYIEDYLPEKGVILDAGGGTGKWSIQMAKKGFTVHLVDLSPEMLKEASQKIDDYGLSEKVLISEGDILDLEFPSNFFDFVLCEGDPVSYCAEAHIEAIRELVRVARPGSIIEVGVDNRYMFFLRESANKGFSKGSKVLEDGIAVDKRGTRTFTFTPRIFQEEFDACGADLLKVVGKPVFLVLAAPYFEDINEKVMNDPEFRRMILKYELILNEEGFGPVGNHLQAIAQKR